MLRNLGELWYYSAHFMEYERGSSAINEWTIQTLALAKGYFIETKESNWPLQSIDQIALGTPSINGFMAQFLRNVKLTPNKLWHNRRIIYG